MSNTTKNWEEIGISNDFLFGKIMRNPELCKELLERILPDVKIDHVEYPELQKVIQPDVDAKSVRLDIYVKGDDQTVYNLEMQAIDTRELPKRARYYGSMIDLQLIDSGQTYSKLKRRYVIFICPFDIYNKGRHIYTFENTCKEDQSILMGDETVKIFLNADSEMDDVNPKLKAFLDYVAGKKSEDAYVKKLETAVKEAKKNREWRHEYMTLLMRDRENIEKGKKQVAQKMLEEKMDIGIIVKVTGLTEKELKQIEKEKDMLVL